MRVAAYQNNVFIAMCNRVGREGEMEFSGESLIAHPSGELVAKAGNRETLLTAEIDLAEAHAYRKTKPYLSLLRPECY
jgi:N-carbamoylputrescine amidase